MIARVAVTDGHADSVTIENVPSYTVRLDATVEVPEYGTIPYSLAFGGNFYAMVDLDAVGLEFDRANQEEILSAGLAIMNAINETDPPKHPEIDGGLRCHPARPSMDHRHRAVPARPERPVPHRFSVLTSGDDHDYLRS